MELRSTVFLCFCSFIAFGQTPILLGSDTLIIKPENYIKSYYLKQVFMSDHKVGYYNPIQKKTYFYSLEDVNNISNKEFENFVYLVNNNCYLKISERKIELFVENKKKISYRLKKNYLISQTSENFKVSSNGESLFIPLQVRFKAGSDVFKSYKNLFKECNLFLELNLKSGTIGYIGKYLPEYSKNYFPYHRQFQWAESDSGEIILNFPIKNELYCLHDRKLVLKSKLSQITPNPLGPANPIDFSHEKLLNHYIESDQILDIYASARYIFVLYSMIEKDKTDTIPFQQVTMQNYKQCRIPSYKLNRQLQQILNKKVYLQIYDKNINLLSTLSLPLYNNAKILGWHAGKLILYDAYNPTNGIFLLRLKFDQQ